MDRTWAANFWENLRSRLWFFPTLLLLLSVVIAAISLTVDAVFQDDLQMSTAFFFRGGKEESREILSVIAQGMLSIATVSFSVTIVALSLAASQFGSRLLRNLMSDKATQIVIGCFMGVFLYSLIVLMRVGGDDTEGVCIFLTTSASQN
jgi:uncharacterized membrane protein